MIKKNAIGLILFALLLAACSSEQPAGTPKGCLDNMPQSIPGLEVAGARTKANVIQNLWPVICQTRDIYQQRLKDHPRLKGIIEIQLSVEFNGEIGRYTIVRSTLEDPAFERQVLAPLQFMDFDPFGPQNSETEIRLPIRLTP